MKFISFLIALLIAFLAFQQGVSLLLNKLSPNEICCVEQCSKKEGKNEKQKPNQNETNDSCKGKNCNPFQPCCKYILAINNVGFLNFTLFITTLEINTFNFISKVTFKYSQLWKPPQVKAHINLA